MNTSNGLDIRIAKGYGSRGYDKIRLSVISRHAIIENVVSKGVITTSWQPISEPEARSND